MKDRDWYDAEKVKKASVSDCIKQLGSRDLCDYCRIALGRLEELIKSEMRSEYEIRVLLNKSMKDKEMVLNTKIRNGQHLRGIKEALKWVIKDEL